MTSPAQRESDCPARETLERAAIGADTAVIRDHLDTCPRCAREIRRIQRDNAFLADFLEANAEEFEPGGPGAPTIEGYELLGEVHRGSQGVVYRARQTATKRIVAVKTLARGAFATARQRRRFEREVELVATLRHPNVVTLFDSGRTSDGGHYLAMEFVVGVTLDRHVSRPTYGAPAGIPATLNLFAQICAGVNAAHQRGIIHRDLKPANILVDAQSVPRVLDFGLAKRAGQALETMGTVEGEFLGTFAYAAPEQLEGDPLEIDVRSDVYALGVILYEMLTGSRPYAMTGGVTEFMKAIIDEKPTPPVRMGRRVDDELETIVMKSLAKNRDRRYQSAGALLEDVQNYLNGDPINAKRDSRWYLARKMLSRHRVAVGVIALFFALLVTFGITMTVLYQQATSARRMAATETVRATETLGSFLQLLASDPLRERVNEDTMSNLFEEAERIVESTLAEHPDVGAAVRRELGLTQLRRGEYEYALRQFRAAVEIERERADGDDPALAEALHNEGRALWYLGRDDAAEQRYREALRMRQAVFEPGHELIATSMSHLGATLRRQGKYVEAERWYREALELRRARHGASDPRVARSLNSLGVCLRDQRRYDEALPLFMDALEILRAAGTTAGEGESTALHNAGSCLIMLGRYHEANEALMEARRLKLLSYEDSHTSVALTESALAHLRCEQGRLDEAERLCRAALASQEAAYGSAHTEIADSLVVLGRILLARDRPDEAREMLDRALAIREARFAPDHWKVTEVTALLESARSR